MRVEKDINLIPSENVAYYKRSFTATTIFFGALILAIVVMLAYIIPSIQLKQLKAENTKILNEITSLGEVNERVTLYEQKQLELKNKKEVLDTIENNKVKVLDLIKGLSSYLPENVFVSSLSMSGEGILNISFVIDNPIDTAKLVVKLREMDAFESVELNSVPIESKQNTINFTLKLKEKKQGEGVVK